MTERADCGGGLPPPMAVFPVMNGSPLMRAPLQVRRWETVATALPGESP